MALPWLTKEMPQGTIELWAGTIASIPAGWGICDGTQGTPDLIDKFVKGIATSVTEPGTLGGDATVTLTSAQIAAHNHTSVSYLHKHTLPASTGDGTGGVRYTNAGTQDDQQNTDTRLPPSQNLIATGSSGPHDNIPPYYTIAYIMKL